MHSIYSINPSLRLYLSISNQYIPIGIQYIDSHVNEATYAYRLGASEDESKIAPMPPRALLGERLKRLGLQTPRGITLR